MRLDRSTAAVAGAVAAAALWALGGTLAGEVFRRGAEPLAVVAVRTWVALLGLALLLSARRPSRPVGRVPWGDVVGFGVATAAANAALFLAIDRLPVAVALVLLNLAPAFVVAWVAVTARRRPEGHVIAALGVAIVGVGLVVDLPNASLGSSDLTGVAFGVATAAGVAVFSAYGARAAKSLGALPATTYAFAVSSLLWAAYALAQKGHLGVPTAPPVIAGVLAIGLLGTLLPFLVYAWATARTGAQVGTVVMCLEPLFGALLGYAWLDQRLTPVQIAGGAVLLLAVAYLQRRPAAAEATGAVPALAAAARPQP